MKNVRKWYNGFETYFDNKQMYQILLKVNNQIELTNEEIKELDYWVFAYDYRNKLYKQLKMVIEMQKDLSIAKDSEILNVGRRIKSVVPDKYINILSGSSYHLIRSGLLFGLKMYGDEIALRLIRGKMQGAIVILIVILLVVGAFAFFIFLVS